jgi:hypothetical protein
VVVSLLNTRHHTPVIKRSANPEYSFKDATFDFPIHLSLADRLGTIEVVVWDKENMIKKEYLGEVALPLEDWFKEGNAFGFYDDQNRVGWLYRACCKLCLVRLIPASAVLIPNPGLDTSYYACVRVGSDQGWVRDAPEYAIVDGV